VHKKKQKKTVTGIALAYDEGKAAYIPLGHDDQVVADQLTLDEFQDAFSHVLQDEKINLTGHNVKDSLLVLQTNLKKSKKKPTMPRAKSF